MALALEEKRAVIDEYKLHDADTGSPEVQIALLTQRINHLNGHFKIHKKDLKTSEMERVDKPARSVFMLLYLHAFRTNFPKVNL